MTWFQTVLLDLQTYTQLMNMKNQVCFSILNTLSYRSLYTALLPVLQRSEFCYYRFRKHMKVITACGYFSIYSLSCSYICKMSLSLRSGHLMCTYKSFVPKTLEIIFFSDYQAHKLLLQMLPMTFWTLFLILCI